ncbi:Hypothetical protein CCH01_013740 [Clostridium chauvoei JF4335]|nr:Hypothetical protein CCH01_013740 [Clostridium chauvoei JF4335]
MSYRLFFTLFILGNIDCYIYYYYINIERGEKMRKIDKITAGMNIIALAISIVTLMILIFK